MSIDEAGASGHSSSRTDGPGQKHSQHGKPCVVELDLARAVDTKGHRDKEQGQKRFLSTTLNRQGILLRICEKLLSIPRARVFNGYL